MLAVEKLNWVYVIGVLIAAGYVGLSTNSTTAFAVSAAALTYCLVSKGAIR